MSGRRPSSRRAPWRAWQGKGLWSVSCHVPWMLLLLLRLVDGDGLQDIVVGGQFGLAGGKFVDRQDIGDDVGIGLNPQGAGLAQRHLGVDEAINRADRQAAPAGREMLARQGR